MVGYLSGNVMVGYLSGSVMIGYERATWTVRDTGIDPCFSRSGHTSDLKIVLF